MWRRRNSERRATLEADGDTLARFYMGYAADPGELHARAEGSCMLYESAFALNSAPATGRLGSCSPTMATNSPSRARRPGRCSACARQAGFRGRHVREAPDGGPHLAYRLHTEDGRTIRYRYYGEAETDKPVQFYRSDQPWTYRAPSKQLAAVDALTPKTLIASDDGSAGSATKPDAPTPADTAPSSAEMATAPPS